MSYLSDEGTKERRKSRILIIAAGVALVGAVLMFTPLGGQLFEAARAAFHL